MKKSMMSAIMSGIVGGAAMFAIANTALASTLIGITVDLKNGSVPKTIECRTMHLTRDSIVESQMNAGNLHRPKSIEITILANKDTALADSFKTHAIFDGVLTYWSTVPNRQLKLIERITLTNATISNFKIVSREGNDTQDVEEIDLVFQKIEFQTDPGSTSAADDWTAGN